MQVFRWKILKGANDEYEKPENPHDKFTVEGYNHLPAARKAELASLDAKDDEIIFVKFNPGCVWNGVAWR